MKSYTKFNPLIEIKEEERKGNCKMAFKLIKKITPVGGGGRGRVATVPSVVIAERGQLSLNSLASRHISEGKYALIGFDEKTRVVIVAASDNLPKGFSDNDVAHWGMGKKTGIKYCTASSVWTEVGYDFKASGRQKFDVKLAENKDFGKYLSFAIPTGALTPLPVTPRVKKTKTPVVAETPIAPAVDDEASMESLLLA